MLLLMLCQRTVKVIQRRLIEEEKEDRGRKNK